jgi:RNA polymerase sigma factor (sigma-70 family)
MVAVTGAGAGCWVERGRTRTGREAWVDANNPTEVTALVEASARGDQRAWNELVARFAHVVISVTRQYRLPEKDAEDVSQTVWLRLVEHLTEIRNPEALAGWLIATAKNECLRLIRLNRRTQPMDPSTEPPVVGSTGEDQATEPDVDLIRAERQDALRRGLWQLAPRDRELLLLLVHDPPLSYAEIGSRMDMPVGSIGPTRKRCLEKLRRSTAVAQYLESIGIGAESGGGRHAFARLE